MRASGKSRSGSSRRRQLARAVVKAQTLEARREAAAALSNLIDMEEGWVPPIPNLGLDSAYSVTSTRKFTSSRRVENAKSKARSNISKHSIKASTQKKSERKNYVSSGRKGRVALGSLNNMDPISARQILVKAARDLEHRTVGRLVEDRETKAKIRNGAPLTPVGKQSLVPKTLEEYEAAGISELLEGYMSPEPTLSSPGKSESLQKVLSEMQSDSKSEHWSGDSSKHRKKTRAKVRKLGCDEHNPTKPISNLVEKVPILTKRAKEFVLSSEPNLGSMSQQSSDSVMQNQLPNVPKINIDNKDDDRASTARSDTSSGTRGEFDYSQHFLHEPRLLGVKPSHDGETNMFIGLAPCSAFFGQFLNGGALQDRLSDPALCFPDTLVRICVNGNFRWVWIEHGVSRAEEIVYEDESFCGRREHILACLCGGNRLYLEVDKTEPSSNSFGAAMRGSMPDTASMSPLAVLKRSTGTHSAETKALFGEKDIKCCLQEMFSHTVEDAEAIDENPSAFHNSSATSCLVLQKYVGGCVREYLQDPETKDDKKFDRASGKHEWFKADDSVSRLVRVRSRCGRGSATVWTIEGGGNIALSTSSIPNLNCAFNSDTSCDALSRGISSRSKVVPGSEAGIASMNPVHLVSAHDPCCRVKRYDSLAARQTRIGQAVSLVRSLVHLLSDTYSRLMFSELTADYIPDKAVPGKFWLIQIKAFRAKGPASALPPAERSSKAALGAAAVALATSRSALRSAPSGRIGAVNSSLPLLGGSLTCRQGILQNAWRTGSSKHKIKARNDSKDHAIRNGIRGKKGYGGRPASSMALRESYPKSKNNIDRKSFKCPGNYCAASGKPGDESCEAHTTILFKSIAEDRVRGRPGESLPPRYRARMYDEVTVCSNCFKEYTHRDLERSKALARAQARAKQLVIASEAKYAKFIGKGPRGKVNPANSTLIKRYEAQRAKEKNAKQQILKESLEEKKLKSKTGQRQRKLKQTTLSTTSKTENLAIVDVATKETQKNSVDHDDDENQCLLCGAGIAECKCSLSPRPEVRALMNRVDARFFS